MAGLGRGRGRGRGAMFNRDPQMSQSPGSGSISTTSDDLKVKTLLNSLSCSMTSKEIQLVADEIKKCNTSKEHFERVIQALLAKCQSNWRFSCCAAQINNELNTFKADDGTMYRSFLLAALNAEFKKKESLREDSSDKFLGSLSLMCQVFGTLRKDGEPFWVLSNACVESLEMLLDNRASNEEMSCAVTQMQAVGHLLQETADATRLLGLKNLIRDKIVDSCGSRDVRLQLIEVLEGFASDWTIKPI